MTRIDWSRDPAKAVRLKVAATRASYETAIANIRRCVRPSAVVEATRVADRALEAYRAACVEKERFVAVMTDGKDTF